MQSRSLTFRERQSGRYWWFQNIASNYMPPIFELLTDKEWSVIDEWYNETDSSQTAAEANVPVISILQGLILGSNIKNVVQLGHYEGFSTLLFGFMLRKMGFKNSLFTVDIDQSVSDKTQYWVDKAGLQDYVKVVVANSSDKDLPQQARVYFKDDINFIFIDSSHQYAHTLEELNLWYKNLKDLGIMALHDVSQFAVQFDYTKAGGVNKAIKEWAKANNISVFLLNEAFGGVNRNYNFNQAVYKDACGLGLIQKV